MESRRRQPYHPPKREPKDLNFINDRTTWMTENGLEIGSVYQHYDQATGRLKKIEYRLFEHVPDE